MLIEKPMAVNLSDARQIAELAQKKDLIVQVGHQERFVARAIGLDKVPERPVLIKAERLNPYSPRGTDTSVTMDLMTHDIDLACWLFGETPRAMPDCAEWIPGAGDNLPQRNRDCRLEC